MESHKCHLQFTLILKIKKLIIYKFQLISTIVSYLGNFSYPTLMHQQLFPIFRTFFCSREKQKGYFSGWRKQFHSFRHITRQFEQFPKQQEILMDMMWKSVNIQRVFHTTTQSLMKLHPAFLPQYSLFRIHLKITGYIYDNSFLYWSNFRDNKTFPNFLLSLLSLLHSRLQKLYHPLPVAVHHPLCLIIKESPVNWERFPG